jgi:hypothetical protein
METNLLSRISIAMVLISVFSMSARAQNDNVGLNGPATINGWIQYGPVMMIQSQTNPTQYSFNGYLNAGEFKISTNAGWTPAWGPTINDTPVNASGYTGVLVANTGAGPDNKFSGSNSRKLFSKY